jgi:aminoglycoside phosphotransferase
MLTRVKGHGRRATYVARSNRDGSGWHMKLRPGHEREMLTNEAQRINWMRKHTTIPVPQSAGSIGTPYVGILFTRTVDGEPAHHLIKKLGPKKLVHALSDGMHQVQVESLHDFPFAPPEWVINKAVSIRRINDLDELRQKGKKLHPGFDELSNAELIKIIEQGSDVYEQRAFVHGDLCMPNMLMSPDGKFTGLIDLGALHVGNPTLDMALLAWCINDNLGPKWADYFLKLHNLDDKDPQIQFYRLAYDLSLNFPDPWGWTKSPKIVHRRTDLEGVQI